MQCKMCADSVPGVFYAANRHVLGSALQCDSGIGLPLHITEKTFKELPSRAVALLPESVAEHSKAKHVWSEWKMRACAEPKTETQTHSHKCSD